MGSQSPFVLEERSYLNIKQDRFQDNKMGCCEGLFRILLFVANFVILGCGLAFVTAGAVVKVYLTEYESFVEGQVVATSIVLIVAGVCVCLVGFMGCCGACMGNSCMLKTYGILLTVLLIAEIGVGIAAFVYKGQVEDSLKSEMAKLIPDYDNASGNDTDNVITDAWDALQENFKCCGVSNYTDWKDNKNMTSLNVPDSCCKIEAPGCGKGQQSNPSDIYTDGCVDSFKTQLEDHIEIVGGVGVGICVLQLIAIIVSFWVGKKMAEDNYFA